MFENIIAQDAAAQIAFDIERREIPPSILLQGPPLSGKGATALEAARVFSCITEDAPWGCGCEHCAHHRLLSHPDLLVTGRRPFLPEIHAAKEAFFREALPATKMLFVRAVKKLLLRFSAVLAEGDTRLSKINGPLEAINGDLEEWAARALETEKSEKEAESFLKLTDAIIKNAVKLDADGIADTIPVSHIRAASYWLHTAPAGNKKVLVIENAEMMLDAARNSLLKTLEEPPKDAVIILTSAHPKILLATILSRVRPYSFVQRNAEHEADVLRRVFREKTVPASTSSSLSDYFERCSGVSKTSIEASAALWVASAAAAAVLTLKKTHGVSPRELPPELVALGKHAAPIAEKAEYGRPNTNLKTLLETIMEKTAAFAERETFTRFLEETLSVIRGALFTQEITPLTIHYTETGRAHVRAAHIAVETYNQGKTLALERLFLSLADSFSRLG
ncbi:MAG: DNA polymerase III [Spirochaetaceae bacterium]|jgi:DNA polymerase-3 subunit gamma/tau|nr:DNA polymerase III [Spirochaetaceae bacterium]